jgi:type II secretory pathway pseudopilin PulG
MIELLFVFTLLGILTLALVNFFVSSARGYKYLQVESDTSVELSNTIGRVSRVIRSTTDVVDAQTGGLTIYAYFSPNDAVVSKVRYFMDGTTLKTGVIHATGSAPNYTYDVAGEKIYSLRTFMTNGSTPIFTYYSDTGTQLSGAFAVTQIKQIGININTNPNPKVMRKSLGMQTTVTLRNKKTNL